MIIWAKLTQGNGRGTCCWITHILNNTILPGEEFFKSPAYFTTVGFFTKPNIFIENKDRRIKWIP